MMLRIWEIVLVNIVITNYHERLEVIKDKLVRVAQMCKETENASQTNLKGLNKNGCYVTKLTVDAKKILNEILNENVVIYNLRGVMNTYSSDKNNSIVGNAGGIFSETLINMYKKLDTTQHTIENEKKSYVTTDKKIAIYMTMKELYDRWKFGTWRPNSNDTTYGQNLMVGLENFVFLDSQYDDIEQKIKLFLCKVL